MAGRLTTKTFLVLSLPIISIVSLYVYCRRQCKQITNSDQPQADTKSSDSTSQTSLQQEVHDLDQQQATSICPATDCPTKDEMQLIPHEKPASDKPIAPSLQANGIEANDAIRRDVRSTLKEDVETSQQALKLHIDSEAVVSPNSSKPLTFAQVLDRNNQKKTTATECCAASETKKSESKVASTNGPQERKSKEKKKKENSTKNHVQQDSRKESDCKRSNERGTTVNSSIDLGTPATVCETIKSPTKLISSDIQEGETEELSVPTDDATTCVQANDSKTCAQPVKPVQEVEHLINIDRSDGDAPDTPTNNEHPKQHLIDVQTQAVHYSDVYSENSSDSGKGSSEINRNETPCNPALVAVPPTQLPMTADYHLPNTFLPQFYGRNNSFIGMVQSKSEVDIMIKPSPFEAKSSICTITGLREQLHHAMLLIHERFPPTKYPFLDIQYQIAPMAQPEYPVVPVNHFLQLPFGASDVLLASMVDAGQMYLHQPNHPSFQSIRDLITSLNLLYSSTDTPPLPSFTVGMICVAPFQDSWHRAMICNYVDETSCFVQLVDLGTIVQMPYVWLRQISPNLMDLPFQACKCLLYRVEPVDAESGWSDEANTFALQTLQSHFLKAIVVSFTETGIPLVNMFKVVGDKV